MDTEDLPNLGINSEFLDWLLDPVANGGGAITDFGCYGANLMTWLTHGERPKTVTAVTQQLQAENNPKVDDDATIILIVRGFPGYYRGLLELAHWAKRHGTLWFDRRHLCRQS